jgi:hypothetical protein
VNATARGLEERACGAVYAIMSPAPLNRSPIACTATGKVMTDVHWLQAFACERDDHYQGGNGMHSIGFGIPEIMILLVVAAYWAIPLAIAIWVIVTIRASQQSLQLKLDTIERLLQRS